MPSTLLYRNRRAGETTILDEVYRVDLCADAPLFKSFPPKFLVMIHVGRQRLRISFEGEHSHAHLSLAPGGICALPLKPSLHVHWENTSDLLLLSLDYHQLHRFAMAHSLTGIDLGRSYLLHATPANRQVEFLIEELMRKKWNLASVHTLLRSFLLLLLRDCNHRTWLKAEPSVFSEDLQRVLSHIQTYLGEELHVAELAGLMGLGRHQFFRVFRKATGLNPHQWILRARLQEAATLLQDPTLTISQIVGLTGFFDQSHLTRKFRRLYKCTPNQYRIHLQNEKRESSPQEKFQTTPIRSGGKVVRNRAGH